MVNRIGIRLEDKNEWERRAPIIPSDIAKLASQGLEIQVERFPGRAFDDAAYVESSATLVDNTPDADLLIGVKEMPVRLFKQGGAYIFFSHTIKGQPYNMKMLGDLVEKKCTLIDYELITDEKGRRLVFFGRFAGLAGMIDTLWTLGRRLESLGHKTPFLDIEPTHRYASLDAARESVAAVGARIEKEGLPAEITPLVFGFCGYGNVSQGAQEILDLLPHEDVAPAVLEAFVAENTGLANRLAKVVYKEEHIVEPTDPSKPFELQEYYDHPERYRTTFEPHLKQLSVLVNGIYWEERYPKLADADQLREIFSGDTPPRLLVVGDITCDVDGSLACTMRDTEPGDPVYIYNPETRDASSGFDGPGLAVMAVGNLPTELPREASKVFSEALTPFIPALAEVNFNGSFDEARLPDPIRRAVILWCGEFTPDFQYMQEFLRQP